MAERGREQAEKGGALQTLINSGVEIAGGAVGGAAGFFAAGPIGAAALGAAGVGVALVLKQVGMEVSQRLLGPREKMRIGAVLGLAVTEIRERIHNGDSVRSDGFFGEKGAGRSDAKEVAESLLLKAQREPEERKIPYMAHLLSGVVFDGQISAELAHQMIKIAEQLTYRQLCIMKLAAVRELFGLRDEHYREHASFPRGLLQVLHECMDLYHRSLLGFGGKAALGLTDVVPARMTPRGLGIDLYRLMRLELIPNDDLLPIAAELK